MTTKEEYPPSASEQEQAPEPVERLLTLTGPPSSIPENWIDSLKATVRPIWQEALHQERKPPGKGGTPRGWILGGLLAATLLLALVGTLFWERALRTGPHPLAVGETAALVQVVRGPSDCSSITEGEEIAAGTTLLTCPDSGMALRMAVGASLRLDADTEVQILSAQRLALRRGSIYLDCNPREVMVTLEVVTPFGSLYDLGTQFLVTVGDSDLTVQVREGAVELRRDGYSHRALPGKPLRAHQDGTVQHPPRVAPTDPLWHWVLPLAPTFQTEGRSLGEFLEWIHRETGYTIQFSDARLAARAKEIILEGRIDDLPPDEALAAVLSTTGLQHRMEDGQLVIWQPTPP